MKGATGHYYTIKRAVWNKLGDLRKLNLKYGWNGGDSEAFIHGNVVFVTSTHARGECFQMFLVEDPHASDERIKNEALEVYGVVSGNPGWTEVYDWIHKGEWVEFIENYLRRLETQLQNISNEQRAIKEDKQETKDNETSSKLDKFNNMFLTR
ncbi:hypothetical protein COF68_06230 [Bacillus toyonensis]|uniref:hypothetical protein n=1 Tax=Bacillus toyonensis TaxID=155322 RepID=UPI000BFC1AAC|nr:hypothetical protein [Bacillus toyonensis]PHE64431.1 hypothetical protein COF68_06230 [Bacillus toyonensis]